MYSSILDLKTPLARTQDEAMFPEHWDGIVAAWPLIEGGGATAFDFSGQGRHGATTGNPVWQKSEIGTSLNFNGTSQFITIPSLSEIEYVATFQAWIKTTSTTEGYVWAQSNVANTGNLALFMLESGVLAWFVYVASSFTVIYSTTVVNDGEWHCVTATRARNIATIAVDGVVEASSSSFLSSQVKTGQAFIGTNLASGGKLLNASLSALQLYDVDWSADRIASSFARGPNSLLVPRRRRSAFAAQLAATANRRRRLLTACG